MAMLSKIELLNFRNISRLQLDFEKGVNLLVGKNGQGKTNIIESIYFLTTTLMTQLEDKRHRLKILNFIDCLSNLDITIRIKQVIKKIL